MAENSSVTVLGTADACFQRTVFVCLQFLQMFVERLLRNLHTTETLNSWQVSQFVFHICARRIISLDLFVFINKIESHRGLFKRWLMSVCQAVSQMHAHTLN